jgi:hypothetical protein
MCYIDGQKNKYSVLNECNRMLKYNVDGKVQLEIWWNSMDLFDLTGAKGECKSSVNTVMNFLVS